MMGAHSIGSEEGAVVAAETQSLYERLGGVYAIAVVDDFIDRIMVDPRLNANPRVDEAHHRVSAWGIQRGSAVLTASVNPTRINENFDVTAIPESAVHDISERLETRYRFNSVVDGGEPGFAEVPAGS
jgi:hypothetical protein